MLNILCIGDPHFKISNLYCLNDFINFIKQILIDKKPDITVILGDLLDKHHIIFTQCFNKSLEFLKICSSLSDTYLLIGNHDMINNQVFLTEDHGFNGIKNWENLTIVDKPIMINKKDIKLCFCPYVYPGRFIEALNHLKEEESKEGKYEEKKEQWKNCNCIFAHQEFKGCSLGSIKSKKGDVYDSSYPLVISGHIHDEEILQENIIYVGSSIKHSFTEKKKYLNIFTFSSSSSGSVNREKIDINILEKNIFYMNVNKLFKNKNLLENKVGKNNDIRVTLNDTNENLNMFKSSSNYKDLINKGIKIYFNPLEKINNNIIHKNFETLLKNLIDKEDEDIKKEFDDILNSLI